MSETGSSVTGIHVPATLAALIALVSWMYWPSIAALAELWSHPERRTYQHGYLMTAVVVWLMYRDRRRIAAAVGAPAPGLLLLGAFASVMWAVAQNAGLQVVHVLLWPLVVWSIAAGLFGWRAGRVLLTPLAILYFALPVWDALTPGLQAVTVFANQIMATLLGVPVVIEDTLIHIPEGSFEIAGGCSGLNYLVVGLAIGALLGELNRDSVERRILLIALAGGLALVSNWVRVFIIIYAGHLSNMTHYLVRVDHYKWGWVLFSFMLVLYFLAVRRLPPGEQPSSAPEATGGAAFQPRAATYAGACLAIALGPALVAWQGLLSTPGDITRDAGARQLEIAGSGGWRVEPATSGWLPVFPGADAESLVEYTQGGDRVTVYSATYLRQSQGRELVGFDSRIGGREPDRMRETGRKIRLPGPGIVAAEGELRDPYSGHALLWWTYQVGQRRFASGLSAQIWYGLTSLWSTPVSAIVAVRVECRPDCDQARDVFLRFAADTMPELLAAAARTDG